MSKAEEYIRKHTKALKESNGKEYFKWLSPDQARRAVEIAREEIYEWLKDNIYMYNGECEGDRKAIIEDLKQAMKDD